MAIIPRGKPQLDAFQSMYLIAHRGAHEKEQGFIENTLEAFEHAKNSGCWGIEFDVRVTADKVLVVNHDATLHRLWGLDLSIADLNFSELRALVPDIPTLAEVIARYGHCMHLLIELKTPFRDEAVLIDALKGLSAGEHYHLLTLNADVFDSLSHFPSHALLLVARHDNVQEFCDLSLKENYGGVLGHYLMLSDRVVSQLKTTQKIAGVGFVDSQNSLYRELNRGLSWIFTNRAAKVNACLMSLLPETSKS